MAFTGYYGVAGGSVQTAYQDQPGRGVSGELMNASDINLCDAMYVLDANGVAAGAAVKMVAVSPADAYSQQIPSGLGIETIPAGAADTDVYGFVVFDEGMQSDSNGNPGWNTGRIAMVMRTSRVGGRMWFNAKEAFTVGTSTVNVVTTGGTATSGAVYVAGDIAPAAVTGQGTCVSVAITNAKVIASGVVGDVAGIEFLGVAG